MNLNFSEASPNIIVYGYHRIDRDEITIFDDAYRFFNTIPAWALSLHDYAFTADTSDSSQFTRTIPRDQIAAIMIINNSDQQKTVTMLATEIPPTELHIGVIIGIVAGAILFLLLLLLIGWCYLWRK